MANSFFKRTCWSYQISFSNNPRDDSTHGHHQIVNTEIRLIIFFEAKEGETIQPAKTRPGADCDSDHELLIVEFRLKMKKIGEITRPFRYNPNQIPYDYSLEVRDRVKGLDLVDTVPEELWMDIFIIKDKSSSLCLITKMMKKLCIITIEMQPPVTHHSEVHFIGPHEYYSVYYLEK